MLPVLARGGRVTLVLRLWLIIGGTLAALLAGQGGLGWASALLVALFLAVGYTFAASEAADRRALEVQILSREAELRALRAQIDPHFLFNSLHSISALTGANPAGARRMCLLLADFLRQSLALGAHERIPLAWELELAAKYLEIEQVRYRERLAVEIDGGNAGDCLVPSLLLQPIVEHAVTHGVAHLVGGGTVHVRASCTPSQVRIRVDSPCDSDRPKSRGAGVGLTNVRARLRAVYGPAAIVTAAADGDRWRVDLVLPAHAPAGARHAEALTP